MKKVEARMENRRRGEERCGVFMHQLLTFDF
jgi:hypothetical protein